MNRLLGNNFRLGIFLIGILCSNSVYSESVKAPMLPPVQEDSLTPSLSAGATLAGLGQEEPLLFTGKARVVSKVDKLIIFMGDIISYEMEVEIPEEYSVATLPPGAQLGEFLIRSYDFPKKPVKKRGQVIFKFSFKLTAYTTGELKIPPVTVIIQKDGRPVRVLLTQEIGILIVEVSKPEDLEIKDVKSPVAIPFNYKPLLIFALAVLGMGAIALGSVIIWKKLKKPEIKIPEPLPPPEELAEKELAELESLGLLEKGEVGLYYTKLNQILRRYLGLRFQIYALEFTTSEIMLSLKDKWLEHSVYQLIEGFLKECDLVKFARFIPEPKAQKEIGEKAKKIIEKTRVQEKPIEETIVAGTQ